MSLIVGTFIDQMLFAAASMTLHCLPVAILWILAASKAFTAGVGTLAFSSALEENGNVFVSKHESLASFACPSSPLAFAVPLTPLTKMALNGPSKLAYGATGKTSPDPLRFTKLGIDMCCGFILGHVSEVRHV